MTNPETFFDAFMAALHRAADYNRADQARPVCVLWTDKERQWEMLLPRLKEKLPLLALGPYDPAVRTGPAIWLRCMIARTLPEADWPEEETPVLYLPGVSRQELRAVEECPRALQPLAELQYRGALWTQRNGKDWTIEAFLRTADGGLGVEVATDRETREALRRSLLRLAEEPVEALRAEAPLTAAKLNALLNPEPVRRLLLWMSDPAGQRAARSPEEWEAFRALCRDEFGFDPVADGEITAAKLLGGREGIWNTVWNRFAEAPGRYPGLPERLRKARPERPDGLFFQPSSWPQDNEAEETTLREQLLALRNLPSAEARRRIRELEKAQGERRGWVWADLGRSPLACALPALLHLAEATGQAPGGTSPEEIASAYAAGGWKADDAALDALRVQGSAEEMEAVRGAVESFYRPWLQAAAEAFQQAVRSGPLPAPLAPEGETAPKKGCCLLFADGLRYDAGQRVADALEAKGFSVTRQWRFAALPGVTATAKPAVSPVASRLGPGPDFGAVVSSDAAKVTVEVLRRELERGGYEILKGTETGSPAGAAWTEAGSLDSHGHHEGWKLAWRVPEAVREIADRAAQLLESGWEAVRILTDHGWLLLPGGLPKVELPEHLTEERKGRCARLQGSASTDQQVIPWHWDRTVRIAVAPGIGCYTAGKEYEHGGLSPQECVVPLLTVTPAPTARAAAITEVRWTRLRCRVQVEGALPGMTVDLRARAADPDTSLASEPKPVNEQGQASLVVPDETRQGQAALVVLLGPDGQVRAQQLTQVGGEA